MRAYIPHSLRVSWENESTKTAPRRCVNTVDPRGLADWIGVD